MHNNIGGKAMGSGSWSSDTYDRVTRHKIDSGRTFSYTADAFRSLLVHLRMPLFYLT